MGLIFPDPAVIVVKGSLFITVMAGLLYHLITRHIKSSRTAEEALKQSEEKLRLFLETSPAAMAMLDHSMKYVLVSQGFGIREFIFS